jgi:hypothetical protein
VAMIAAGATSRTGVRLRTGASCQRAPTASTHDKHRSPGPAV